MSVEKMCSKPRLAVNMLPAENGEYRSRYIGARGTLEVEKGFVGPLDMHIGRQTLQIFGVPIPGRNIGSGYSPCTPVMTYFLRNAKTGAETSFDDRLPVVNGQSANALHYPEETINDGHASYISKLFLVSGEVKALLGIDAIAPDVSLEIDVHCRNLHLGAHSVEGTAASTTAVMLEFPDGVAPVSSIDQDAARISS